MNTIKGLVIKDLLQLKTYKRTLIVFLITFTLVSLAQKLEANIKNMFIVMMIIGFGMFGIASFSYDEMAKADRYILTLPVTKKEVVLSKYILVIGATIIGSAMGVIISFLITLIMDKQVPNIGELIIFALGGVFGIGIVEAIQIPSIYKWGAEKGRIQIFIIIMLSALVFGCICWMLEKMFFVPLDKRMIMNLPFDSSILNYYLPIILIGATSLIYYISSVVSYRIYSKKEM